MAYVETQRNKYKKNMTTIRTMFISIDSRFLIVLYD